MNTYKTKTILQTLNVIQALLDWLEARSAHRAEIIELLQVAHDEKRDITIEDVQTRLDIVADELDETENLISENDT